MGPYQLLIPTRHIDSMFGVAYPSLHLSIGMKCNYIANAVSNTYDLEIVHPSGYSNGDLLVEMATQSKTIFADVKVYDISIRIKGTKGYNTALDVERLLKAQKPLGLLSPPRIWNRLFHGKIPKDTFCIDDANFGEVHKWLQENITIRDYQIFSKFGSDYSLGFKNPEHATMFKLTFADDI